MSANTLIQNCQITKKVETIVNKMFKMADGYLQDYQKLPQSQQTERCSRNMINTTYESFRKKKEAWAQTAGAQGVTRQTGASAAGGR